MAGKVEQGTGGIARKKHLKTLNFKITEGNFLISPCYNHFMNLNVFASSSQIKDFCQKYYIRQLSFFGSVVRDDFGPQSDIDVLVEFQPDHIPGFDFFLMEVELSQLLGRKVDLQTLNFLSPDIRRSVLTEAIPAYEQP
jgi:uncharacterized protein